MSDYKPVPVTIAKEISETFEKPIVIVLSWDSQHGMLHCTTFGRTAQEKAWAADGGEKATAALGGLVNESIQYEDYRLVTARRLLAALELMVFKNDAASRLAAEAVMREAKECLGHG